MPQVTLSCEADAATWDSPAYGAGVGNHLPVGGYGGVDYRSAVRFPLPSGWTGWTALTKATLNIYTSDFDHVGPRNSSLYVRRMTVGDLWTKSEGSQNCESGFSSGNTTQRSDLPPITTGQVSFSTGTTANSKKSITVTALVEYYRTNGASKIVLILDNVESSDYSEFWSRHKSGGYDITLVLDYEDNAPPTAPTLVAPTAAAVLTDTTPTLDWTHNDPNGDPQASAEVRVWNAAGTTQVGTTQTVSGTASSLAWPNTLSLGTGYQFDVRTADASGYGPWSAKRAFSIKAAPVVVITATRYMEMSGGLPRLRVKWTVTGGTQTKYRVQTTSPTFDSGWVTSSAKELLLASVALTNGSATSVTVSVETSDGTAFQDTSPVQAFTPRWGLTVHRRDLGAVPVSWGTPAITSTVPSGASLVIEYGSNSSAAAAPTAWYSALSSVPKRQWVYYRAWFIPSASAGPTLSKVTIPSSMAVQAVDHWYPTLVAGGSPSGSIAAPWSIDSGEYVYGTRSITCENTGFIQQMWSELIKVRAGRSYILTGLMRSEGNSGATFQLYDADNLQLLTDESAANIASETLADSREWFEADQLDVYRYRSPVWVAPADMDVVVRLRSSGAIGTQSWFDGLKLEESTVATPWGPSAIGAVSLDAGGMQVDATKGGVFRLRGSSGAAVDVVELGARGLRFGPAMHVYAPNSGELAIESATYGVGQWATVRLTSAAAAAGIYSALLINMSGDVAARGVFGRAGDLDRTGMFLGPGNAARDVSLYRSGADYLSFNNAIKFGAAEGGTYQAITLFSGGTDAGGTVIDHGTGSSIYGRIMAYAAGGTVYEVMRWDATTGGRIGFYGAGAPTVGRQTVAGSRGANAALTSLLTALHSLGLINNTTT